MNQQTPEQIEAHLLSHNTESPTYVNLYFIGGSLCIDLDVSTDRLTMMDVYTLHLDGKGYNFVSGDEFKMTEAGTAFVRELYLKTKGETDYYRDKVNPSPRPITR